MQAWIKSIAVTAVLVVIAGAAFSWWAVQQTRYVPEFYQRATSGSNEGGRSAGRVVIDTTVERHPADTEQVVPQAWHATFTVNEINRWLANELPTSFPQLLAQGATDPRICIEDGRVLAAARYQTARFDLVISCELKVEMTAEPNTLALRVKHLRAGALPLPLSNFLRGISKEAAKGDVDIRWDNTQAGPIALVKVPSTHPRYVTSPVLVESVELVDGALVLSGNTGPLAYETFRPRGPLYQFVSYQPESLLRGSNHSDQANLLGEAESAATALR